MKILIAVDGSSCSRKAVEAAASRAWEANNSFLVLSVTGPIPEEPPFAVHNGETARERLRRLGQSFVSDATNRLTEMLPEHFIEGKVVSGPVAETICKFAAAWSADLIMIGSHGRQNIPHLILGSVAEEVLRHSPCSVEVVKEKREFVPGSGPEKALKHKRR